jgi:hypothetical protein
MSYGHDGHEAYGEHDPYGLPQPGAESDPSAGRGRRRKAAREPEPAPGPAYPDPQWDQSGPQWDQTVWDEAQRPRHDAAVPLGIDVHSAEGFDGQHGIGQYGVEADDHRAGHQYLAGHQVSDAGHREPAVNGFAGPVAPRGADHAPAFESEFQTFPDRPLEPRSPRDGDGVAPFGSTSFPAVGRGAFGAAGLAVVTGASAVASEPVLAAVIGLSQIGLAIGWSRAVDLPSARRTVTLVAAVGLAASGLAYRLAPDRAPAAIGAALGVGFVFLAADQLFRRELAGRRRSESLAAAVTGAAFAALPAGYLVAQRDDSALAAACALAAAVAVLCSALVGGGNRPTGLFAGAAAAVAVGALTAVSLAAQAGARGGAAGGLLSGLFAVAAARTTDRIGSEGGETRITSQALPLAFSAVGAAFAAQFVR